MRLCFFNIFSWESIIWPIHRGNPEFRKFSTVFSGCLSRKNLVFIILFHFLFFSLKNFLSSDHQNSRLCGKGLTLSQITNLDFSKHKKFTDDNFKFDENGIKFSKMVEKTLGKGELLIMGNFSFFPVFSKGLKCRHLKTITCFGKSCRLNLSQMTNFRLFQTQRVCKQRFRIWWKWQKVLQMGRKHCGKRN